VLAFDETLEVSPGPPQGLRLGPIDVSRFRQVRIATRLVEGGAANVTVTALVLMADFPFDVSLLAPGVTLNHSILVDLPGRNLLIALNAASTTTAQISVYGRK
jgi:hypothetical protein